MKRLHLTITAEDCKPSERIERVGEALRQLGREDIREDVEIEAAEEVAREIQTVREAWVGASRTVKVGIDHDHFKKSEEEVESYRRAVQGLAKDFDIIGRTRHTVNVDSGLRRAGEDTDEFSRSADRGRVTVEGMRSLVDDTNDDLDTHSRLLRAAEQDARSLVRAHSDAEHSFTSGISQLDDLGSRFEGMGKALQTAGNEMQRGRIEMREVIPQPSMQMAAAGGRGAEQPRQSFFGRGGAQETPAPPRGGGPPRPPRPPGSLGPRQRLLDYAAGLPDENDPQLIANREQARRIHAQDTEAIKRGRASSRPMAQMGAENIADRLDLYEAARQTNLKNLADDVRRGVPIRQPNYPFLHDQNQARLFEQRMAQQGFTPPSDLPDVQPFESQRQYLERVAQSEAPSAPAPPTVSAQPAPPPPEAPPTPPAPPTQPPSPAATQPTAPAEPRPTEPPAQPAPPPPPPSGPPPERGGRGPSGPFEGEGKAFRSSVGHGMIGMMASGMATMVTALAGIAEAKAILKSTPTLKSAFDVAKADMTHGVQNAADATLDASFAPLLKQTGGSLYQFGQQLEKTGEAMMPTFAKVLDQGAAQAAISDAALRPIMPSAAAGLGATIDSLLRSVSSGASMAGQRSVINALANAQNQAAISDIAGGLIGTGGPMLKAALDVGGMLDSALGGGFGGGDKSKEFADAISVAVGARAGWAAGGPVAALAGAGLGYLTQLQQGQEGQDTTQDLLTAAGGYGLAKGAGLKGGLPMMAGVGADLLLSEVPMPAELRTTTEKAVQGGGVGALLGNALFGGKGALVLGGLGAILNAKDSAGDALGLSSQTGWGKIGAAGGSMVGDVGLDLLKGTFAGGSFDKDFASFRQGVADVTAGPLASAAGAAHDPIDQAVFGEHGFLMHPGMFGPTSGPVMPGIPGLPGAGMVPEPDVDKQLFPPGSKLDTVTNDQGTFQRSLGDDGQISFQNQFNTGASSAYSFVPGQGSVLDTTTAPDAGGAYQHQITTQDPATGITRTQEQDFDPAKGGQQTPLVPIYKSPPPPPLTKADQADVKKGQKGGGPKFKEESRGERHGGGFHAGLYHALSGGQSVVSRPKKDNNKKQGNVGGGPGGSVEGPDAMSNFFNNLGSAAPLAPALSKVGSSTSNAHAHMGNLGATTHKVNSTFHQTDTATTSASAQTRQLDASTQLGVHLDQANKSNAGVHDSLNQVHKAGDDAINHLRNVQDKSGQAQTQSQRQALTPQAAAPHPPPVHHPPPAAPRHAVGAMALPPGYFGDSIFGYNTFGYNTFGTMSPLLRNQQQPTSSTAGGDITPPPDPESAGADLMIYQHHTEKMLQDAGFVLAGVESTGEFFDKHAGHMGQDVGFDTGNAGGSHAMDEATSEGGGGGGGCATGKALGSKPGECASGAAGVKSPATKFMPIGHNMALGMAIGVAGAAGRHFEETGHRAGHDVQHGMMQGAYRGGYAGAANSLVDDLDDRITSGMKGATDKALAGVTNSISQYTYNEELAGGFGAGLVAASNGVTPIAQDYGLMIGYSFAESIVTGAQTVFQSAQFAQFVVPAFKSALAQANLGKLGLLPPAGHGAEYYTTTSGSAGMVEMTPVVNVPSITVTTPGGRPLQVKSYQVLKASWIENA